MRFGLILLLLACGRTFACAAELLPNMVISIGIDASSMQALKKNDRQYASATIQIGESVFTNAGLRLKGMGGFQQLDNKPSFAVKFNEFVKGQKFNGISKILLNNCVQDASYVSEAFCNEPFRDVGLPALRSGSIGCNKRRNPQ